MLKPIATQLATHYGACITTRFVDVDQESDLADAMGVEETPTVIGVNTARQPQIRMVGHDGKPDRLIQVYTTLAANVTSCVVGPFRDV